MRKIVIAGGKGFLGNLLAEHFMSKGDAVFILTRGVDQEKRGVRYLHWDAEMQGDWVTVLEGADVLINLCGRTVNCRYNNRNKKEIFQSRLRSTRILGEALTELENPPKVWLNASSATIYEYSNGEQHDEQNGVIGHGFSVEVCKQWEEAFNSVQVEGVRKVCLRMAMVIGRNGPFLNLMAKIVRLRLGGRQGSGRQFVSWLHQKDLVESIEFLIQNSQLEGVFNLASPNPVSNEKLMKTLREACGVKIGLPAFTPMVHVGAFIMRTEAELPLKSRCVVPGKLLENGYKFHFSDIKNALVDLIRR